MARYYILASMANILQHQHQSIRSAYDMLESLKEMFSEQNRAAKQTTMKALLNTKIAEGSSIRDHVLKMMGLLNELEFSIILLELYNMNKMDLSLAKLLNELQAAESILKQQAPVVELNVEKASISKLKGGKKNKKSQKVFAPRGAAGVKKLKGKCYHCKQPEHHKKQCPAYLAKLNKQGNSNLIIVETCLAAGFQETRRLSENEVCVFQANGEPAPALALEDIRVSFSSDRVLVLKDVLYVPSIRRNLISVSKIMDADDYSKYRYIYLLRRKSECFDKFKEFKTETKKIHDKYIKTLRSDRGGEYLSAEFIKYLSDCGITSQFSTPRTPQQNGVAERRNRTFMKMVRSILRYSDSPSSFWGYALETANYMLNLVPSKSVPSTPVELWAGRKPSLWHIRVWGFPTHVLKGKADKLESRTEVCIFIGYPKGTKGSLFYCPKEKKELSNGVTNDSSLKCIPEASIDIPLHYRSGRNINRQQNAQEQLPDISLPQSSGSNVEQP
ncbi:uncharacterized protein [Nicotiana tomentosiformis]|uniref:uncharacterized protein n=1 Tax=Nicotiana tomentosiformis TaxID=4098 RepID=UPI00388CACE9